MFLTICIVTKPHLGKVCTFLPILFKGKLMHYICVIPILSCCYHTCTFHLGGSSGNPVTTFLGNPKKSHFYWASGIISWSKKRPKSQKQLCTYGIIFPKSGIIPCTRKNFAILVVMSVRNNIPYAHLSVRNIPKKSVRNILPKYSVRSTPPMRNRTQNSFSDVLNWEQEKWEFFYIKPLKSSGSNPKK